jgi:hypothetical protein
MKLFNPSSAMARTPVVHAGCSANALKGKGGVFENSGPEPLAAPAIFRRKTLV